MHTLQENLERKLTQGKFGRTPCIALGNGWCKHIHLFNAQWRSIWSCG